jgi:hypothetical protein
MTVLTVGGDKNYFIAHLENVIPGPDHFTLMGLSWVARNLPPD